MEQQILMRIELEFGLRRQSDRRVLKISNFSLEPNSKARIEYEGYSQEYSLPITISRVRWTFRKDEYSSLINVDYGNYLAASFSINDEDKIDRMWFGPDDTATEYYRVIFFNDKGKIGMNYLFLLFNMIEVQSFTFQTFFMQLSHFMR